MLTVDVDDIEDDNDDDAKVETIWINASNPLGAKWMLVISSGNSNSWRSCKRTDLDLYYPFQLV